MQCESSSCGLINRCKGICGILRFLFLLDVEVGAGVQVVAEVPIADHDARSDYSVWCVVVSHSFVLAYESPHTFKDFKANHVRKSVKATEYFTGAGQEHRIASVLARTVFHTVK